MPFNPDEFLAAKQEKTAPIAFDPDAFLGAAPAPAPTLYPAAFGNPKAAKHHSEQKSPTLSEVVLPMICAWNKSFQP